MNKTTWDTKNAEKFTTDLLSISSQEQEFLVCESRDEKKIHVDCSNGKRLTQLKKNPQFIVTELLLSKRNRILAVKGFLPPWSLTIRKKQRKGVRQSIPAIFTS